MHNPVLIVIHGVKQSGKNTTADWISEFALEDNLTCSQRGFADCAKWAFARQFFPSITMEEAIIWCDHWKLNGEGDLPDAGFTDFNKHVVKDSGWPISGPLEGQEILFRTLLAQFATEGARDIYGEDFWVDQLLPVDMTGLRGSYMEQRPKWWEEFLVDLTHQSSGAEVSIVADIGVVTDCRFENEVHRAQALGGQAWKIKRKSAEDAVIAEAKAKGRDIHRSELGLPDEMFDVVIDNSVGTIHQAKARTKAAFQDHVLSDQKPLKGSFYGA